MMVMLDDGVVGEGVRVVCVGAKSSYPALITCLVASRDCPGW